MIVLKITDKFLWEITDFFTNIKILFTKLISNIHEFLNRFMSDDIILVFGIAIIAFLALLFFRYIINKR